MNDFGFFVWFLLFCISAVEAFLLIVGHRCTSVKDCVCNYACVWGKLGYPGSKEICFCLNNTVQHKHKLAINSVLFPSLPSHPG